MPTRTGAYLAEQRRTKQFSPQRLAAAVGYTNLAKGANRILALERDGKAVGGLLEKIVNALGLDREYVRHPCRGGPPSLPGKLAPLGHRTC